jgi:hypothetical protein
MEYDARFPSASTYVPIEMVIITLRGQKGYARLYT